MSDTNNSFYVDSGAGAATSAPIDQVITLAGTGTSVVPGARIDVTDDMQITATMTDAKGNYTPEGWGNVSSLAVNWTSGSAGTFTGARTPILGNVFFKYPSSPSNGADWYSASIFTANAYTDDNGVAGSPKGHLYGSATVTYLSANVKHWQSMFGIEADMTAELGSSVDTKVGFLSTSSNNDAVQGTTYDAAFMANVGTKGAVGWRNAFQATNIYGSDPTGKPMSSNGTLLGTQGYVEMANAIDVTSATIHSYILKTNSVTINNEGAYSITTGALTGDLPAMQWVSGSVTQHVYTTMGRVVANGADATQGVSGGANQFMPGTAAGDAVYGFKSKLCFGVIGSAPVVSLTPSGGDFSGGTFTATTQASADNSKKLATTAYVDQVGYGLRGHMSGFQLSNNTTDANNYLNIAVGVCRDSNLNKYSIAVAAMTKYLNAVWVAGTNAGGLDTGVKAANTWYYVYAIWNPDPSSGGGDIIFSASPTAPTLPANFTAYRRLRGAIRTDASGNIKAFVQNGDVFKWSVPVLDVSTVNPGTAAVLNTLSVPTGIQTIALIHARSAVTTAATSVATIFTDPAQADTTPDFNLAQCIGNTSLAPFAQLQIGTNTASQIRTRLNYSDANTTIYVVTEGWVDTAAL